jgi:hypothetical protein
MCSTTSALESVSRALDSHFLDSSPPIVDLLIPLGARGAAPAALVAGALPRRPGAPLVQCAPGGAWRGLDEARALAAGQLSAQRAAADAAADAQREREVEAGRGGSVAALEARLTALRTASFAVERARAGGGPELSFAEQRRAELQAAADAISAAVPAGGGAAQVIVGKDGFVYINEDEDVGAAAPAAPAADLAARSVPAEPDCALAQKAADDAAWAATMARLDELERLEAGGSNPALAHVPKSAALEAPPALARVIPTPRSASTASAPAFLPASGTVLGDVRERGASGLPSVNAPPDRPRSLFARMREAGQL